MASNQDVFNSDFTKLTYSNFLEAIVNGYAAITIPDVERREKASISIQTLSNQQCNKSVGTETPCPVNEVIQFEKSTQYDSSDDIPKQIEVIDDESILINENIKDMTDIKDISVSTFFL